MNNRETGETQPNIEVECWLAEFKALRDEILARLRFQLIIMLMNVTAVGTIVGLAFSELWLLVLMPLFASIFGLWFFYEAWALDTAGHYIRDRVAPALRALSRAGDVLGWEDWVRDTVRERRWAIRVFSWRLGAYLFLVPSLLGLLIPIDICLWSPEWWWLRLLWIVALLSTLGLVYFWHSERNYWLR